MSVWGWEQGIPLLLFQFEISEVEQPWKCPSVPSGGVAPARGWVFDLPPMSFATVQYRTLGGGGGREESRETGRSAPDCGGDEVLARMFAIAATAPRRSRSRAGCGFLSVRCRLRSLAELLEREV